MTCKGRTPLIARHLDLLQLGRFEGNRVSSFAMSALERITDSTRTLRHVRKVPIADSCTAANGIAIRSPRRRGRATHHSGRLQSLRGAFATKQSRLASLLAALDCFVATLLAMTLIPACRQYGTLAPVCQCPATGGREPGRSIRKSAGSGRSASQPRRPAALGRSGRPWRDMPS